jgi:hypothetical protein
MTNMVKKFVKIIVIPYSGMSGGLSGIFPTHFGLRAVCREGRREYSRPSLGCGRYVGRVVGNIPDPVWVGPTALLVPAGNISTTTSGIPPQKCARMFSVM